MSDARDLEDLIRGKWFEPVVRELETFENNADVFEEVTAVAEPNSPDWGIRCALKALRPFAQHLGWPIDGKFTSKNVGAMLGAKVSISSGMVNSYRWSRTWTPEIRKKLVDFWGEDDVESALVIWRKFSDRLHPQIQAIRRNALTIAIKQTLLEDLEFSAGIAKGLSLIPELQKLAKKSTKAAVRAHKRGAVYLFAVSKFEEINSRRSELSWPKLSREFEVAMRYHVSIDEDSFKKILQRCGLRIGRPGRPVGMI